MTISSAVSAASSGVTGAVTNQTRIDILLGIIAAVLLVSLAIRRVVHARNLKRRKAASTSYHDSDVAHYGTGPAGFAGAASARSADSTSLAPSFAASGPPTRPDLAAPLTPGAGPSPSGPSAISGLPTFGPPPDTPPPPPPPPSAAQPSSPIAPAAPTAPTAPTSTTERPRPAPVGPAAGWLPDPGGDPDTVRYWDGSGWTDHTARRS